MWKYFMRCSVGDAASGFVYAAGVTADKRIATKIAALRLVESSVFEHRENIYKN